jgi:hypothetical protein
MRLSAECACKLKSSLVPSDCGSAWRSACQDTPLGPNCVMDRDIYLGVCVSTRTRTALLTLHAELKALG